MEVASLMVVTRDGIFKPLRSSRLCFLLKASPTCSEASLLQWRGTHYGASSATPLETPLLLLNWTITPQAALTVPRSPNPLRQRAKEA